jgi:hypothetical protein
MTKAQLDRGISDLRETRRRYREWTYRTNNGYRGWEVQMEVLFDDAGVMDIIDREHVTPFKPTGRVDAEEMALYTLQEEYFNLKDSMVYSLLLRSIHGTATGATDMGMVKKDEGLKFWSHLQKRNEQTETMSDTILLKRIFSKWLSSKKNSS